VDTGPLDEGAFGLGCHSFARRQLLIWTETKAVMEGEKSEFLTHIFLAQSNGSGRLQLARGEKSATSPQFSSDGAFVYFASERAGKRNLYRIAIAGGEAEQLTDWKGTLGEYSVAPDGNQVAFAGQDEDKDAEKRRKEKLDYKVIDDTPRNNALFVFSLEKDLPAKPKRIVSRNYHIGAFDWSPDAKKIAFEHRPRPEADYGSHSDIAEVDLTSSEVRELAGTPAGESSPKYSPDGRYLLFAQGRLERKSTAGQRLVC